MTKQEIIKGKWIELIGKENFNKIKENVCYDDGRIFEYIMEDKKISCKGTIFINNGDNFPDERLPKSLQGIENNNGWISLKENRLPIDDNYYFVNIDNHISIKQFHILQYKWWQEYVTHYQPIVKPQPPIY